MRKKIKLKINKVIIVRRILNEYYWLYLSLFIVYFSCTSVSDKNKFSEIKKTYYDNGNIQSQSALVNGILNGETIYWNENELLISKANYSNNLLHGKWTEYFENGNIKHIIKYHYGLKNSSEIWYFENGNVKSEDIFENGVKVSETIRWDINGDIIYK